ncbi:UDP-glucose 6-dehydrogenase [Mesobacillus campisalis]|uniref:UDP-glucose 6-dehydrogenase n=1 Tax=Mesobacillus campisalis TaxID=1408103 RepID=A0A0M2SRI0_9BACI|nr:UDP-glucose/GDP-mannose dehydrogenase family protein [Mesobacillus campisalis]KKK36281.1 UDP-glucose 6-dehydrogenase [Mesobacillus campisalis]
MKKIAVIGTGYVGLVSGTCFAESGNNVICCDVDDNKITQLSKGEMPIYEPGLEELVMKNTRENRLAFTTNIPQAISQADIVYIAVGTPMAVTGEADLMYVRQAAKTIGQNLNGYKIIVTKSTVPVGTGKLISAIIREQTKIPFDIVSNPEFLREGRAIEDSMNMERAVIGTASSKAFELIAELHKPFTSKIVKTTVETAELIKYAANAFLSTKISFINDIANICERVDADVTKVSEAIGLDSRIGGQFLQAGAGFGGSCFPKDTAALLHIAKDAGYDFKLIQAVMETNETQRLLMVEKLTSALGTLKGKTIAVLGLAFKPGTDDVRSSPALDIIPQLVDRGANVMAYDPVAIEEAKRRLGYKCTYTDDIYQAIEGTNACLILTDWEEVKQIDLAKVKGISRQPVIVDGRNLFEIEAMRQLGFTYLSVGRPAVHNKSIISKAI